MSGINVNLPEKFPESIDTLIGNATHMPAKTFGDTMNSCFYLVFGRFNHKAELQQLDDTHEINRKHLEHKYNLESFENELKEKYLAIPSTKLVEPDFQIVATALDDSKFCLTSETMRDMFTSLIANACNSDKSDDAHPSLSGILRQMSPLDAQTLSLFANKDEYKMAEFFYNSLSEINKHKTVAEFIFLDNAHCPNLIKQARSINSLIRLGLLRIPDDALAVNVKEGSRYHKTDLYLELESKMPKDEYDTVSISETIIRITPLGNSLISVCR